MFSCFVCVCVCVCVFWDKDMFLILAMFLPRYLNHSFPMFQHYLEILKPLHAKSTKWSSTLKKIVGKLPTNYFSVFDHFMCLSLSIEKKRGILIQNRLISPSSIQGQTSQIQSLQFFENCFCNGQGKIYLFIEVLLTLSLQNLRGGPKRSETNSKGKF